VKSYSGTPFEPHARLHAKANLHAGHFGRWLALWIETVDELFAGEHAELAKAHAVRVAQAFHRRLQSYPAPPLAPDAAPADAGLVVTRHAPGTPTER
jgi:hemoglobin